MRIEEDRFDACHIEHVRPRRKPQFADLALDCGSAKEDWFDEVLFVNPAGPVDCSNRFRLADEFRERLNLVAITQGFPTAIRQLF